MEGIIKTQYQPISLHEDKPIGGIFMHKVRQETLDLFWQFVYERQAIWHRRVMLKQPGPWSTSSDIKMRDILNTYKFTNVIRDLDAGTLFYIDNILRKGSEQEQDKRNVLLNTMIYRLFNRSETYQAHGFIHLETFPSDLNHMKTVLRARKANGFPIVTGAHQVNGSLDDLFSNIERWYGKFDEIYKWLTLPTLLELQTNLKTLPGLGRFLSYEIICDLTLSSYYAGYSLVPYDDDSDVSVGPGSSNGLDIIFEDLGTMSKREAIIYLRDTFKHEMQRLNLQFHYPDERQQFTLKSIEHSLCEFSKLHRAYESTGRPRARFSPTNKPDYLTKR